jgi:hypothetical protein
MSLVTLAATGGGVERAVNRDVAVQPDGRAFDIGFMNTENKRAVTDVSLVLS